MFLVETPNDKRCWLYPTYNAVSENALEKCLELIEDENGNIFIEKYPSKEYYNPIVEKTIFTPEYYVRVSSDKYKSQHSESVKRYKAV